MWYSLRSVGDGVDDGNMNEIITGGAVVGGIVTILLALKHAGLVGGKPTQKERTNGPAGDKETAFWQRYFDDLKLNIATLDRIIREHRQLTREEINGLRDLLVDIDTNIKVALATRERTREPR